MKKRAFVFRVAQLWLLERTKTKGRYCGAIWALFSGALVKGTQSESLFLRLKQSSFLMKKRAFVFRVAQP
ncbi:hypothetical protein [Allomuricauda sp. SCSIO 65647]|uniref:hypothetical protein n=1 Tax=Allomuricauda sp. SCSIO 65647 TaxID=2908843 RepID=UPI001F218505|nr:hypothetical protein [Muricauda sp. SCSIO 65647]UJH67515.1 hypothetical protein L0P89_16395 [Muricauda sp. SCSIO 65647]